jgi:hypothetical protein
MSDIESKLLTRVLETARKKLLDTGTRNRLIHVNRANARSNCLNIINERADDVFSILRIDGKRMRFKATGKDKDASSEEILLAMIEDNSGDFGGRHTDLFLETPLGPEALAKRLLRLASDARTAEEEQGVNILYLAIGFLRWRESGSSQVQRESPLILLPVSMIRNEKTSTYDVLVREEDISTNLPLQERLRQDFGIILPQIDEVDGWLPTTYFQLVADSISAQVGWSVDPDGMQLGFFSFAKLLMHRDLDPTTWPTGAFSESKLLQGLLGDGFDEGPSMFDDDTKLDAVLDPADIIQVIDADASQTKVIEEVRRGTSLVVQGPPGTGKSQTITNIIAAAVHDGKSVLFVAEKMAALTVVHDRLVKSGLEDICLELHSRNANKRALAQELGRTLTASGRTLPDGEDPNKLRVSRDELNRITELLHRPLVETGDTPFQTISEIIGFIGKGTRPPAISYEGLETMDLQARRRATKTINEYVKALQQIGVPSNHPFRGVKALDLQPTDVSRLSDELTAGLDSFSSIFGMVQDFCDTAGIDTPSSLGQLDMVLNLLECLEPIPLEAPRLVLSVFEHTNEPSFYKGLEAGVAWQTAREVAGETFQRSAEKANLSALLAGISLAESADLVGLNLESDKSLPLLKSAVASMKNFEEASSAAAILLEASPPASVEKAFAAKSIFDWLSNCPNQAANFVSVVCQVPNLQRLFEALEAGMLWANAQKAARARFLETAWQADASSIRNSIAKGQTSLWARIFGGYGKASVELATLLSGPLPKTPIDRLELANELAEVGILRQRMRDDEAWLTEVLKSEWRGERTPFEDLLATARWLADMPASGIDRDSAKILRLMRSVTSPKLQSTNLENVITKYREELASLFSAIRADNSSAEIEGMIDREATEEIKSRLKSISDYWVAARSLGDMLLGPLPDDTASRKSLVSQLLELNKLRASLSNYEDTLEKILKNQWSGEETAFKAALEIADWINGVKIECSTISPDALSHVVANYPSPSALKAGLLERRNACQKAFQRLLDRLKIDLAEAGLPGGLEETEVDHLVSYLSAMQLNLEKYSDWVEFCNTQTELIECGAGAIKEQIASAALPADEAVSEFLYACADARWKEARLIYPELNQLPHLKRHELVQEFRNLEKSKIAGAKSLILQRHFQQMPRGSSGEMAVVRGEIGRKKGHKPIRWVMTNASTMVQRIKPVFLMSPISVAQFLPPGCFKFDLLVIDEASQIRPEDALGVVARANQIVVVGDQKQLPPTSFFDRLVDDVDDNDNEEEDVMPVGATASDMESILSLCEARGLRQRMLEWHYRSRDPSLIRVSNAEFYGDGLVLPPSPLELDPDYGLKFRRVAGVYARGGSGIGRKGTNRIEAEEIVKAISKHAREWPDLSLGVVAFSKTQADMVTEILELQRRKDPTLDAFLREGKSENVFVKNIENVQGDERDVILITVGYGPQEANGRLTDMSFGPVNNEGGERRLNVLFSRARVRCEVFASFDPGDIDPSRAKRDGTRVLKRFLDYAKTGLMEGIKISGLSADSPFEEDVAAVIRSLGYLADPQVGTAGFKLDIGVRHPDKPGQYLIAVECDGAAYHSSLWARERDRLRQDVLEGLGWKFHRIWSTDWFHRRGYEIDRLKKAIEEARKDQSNGVRITGANKQAQKAPKHEVEQGPQNIEIEHLKLTAEPYQRAQFLVTSAVEPHEAPLSQLSELVVKIVQIEGPIHIDEIARRISALFGRAKAGNRIVDATSRAVMVTIRNGSALRREGDFLMTSDQFVTPKVRNRSNETGSLLKAAYLPPIEIKAAAEQIRKESGDISDDELIREVARLFGFQRVGPDLQFALAAVIRPSS